MTYSAEESPVVIAIGLCPGFSLMILSVWYLGVEFKD